MIQNLSTNALVKRSLTQPKIVIYYISERNIILIFNKNMKVSTTTIFLRSLKALFLLLLFKTRLPCILLNHQENNFKIPDLAIWTLL